MELKLADTVQQKYFSGTKQVEVSVFIVPQCLLFLLLVLAVKKSYCYIRNLS